MNKKEYTLLKAEIVKQLGQPEWEMNKPINESARKLIELRSSYVRELRETEEIKNAVKNVKDLEIHEQLDLVVPEEIIKDSWLSPFNEEQKIIIHQWLTDISQTKNELAKATGSTIGVIRSLFRGDAFKALRKHLELAFKPILPLEALAMLRTLMRSKTENVALQAAKLVLIDAGLYKGESLDVTQHKTQEVVLDAATEEKLRKLGDNVMRDDA